MSQRCHEPTYAVQQITAYSITSSARASSVGGTSRPSALAVFEVDHQLALHLQVGRLLALEAVRRSQPRAGKGQIRLGP
jgi:hypothetical protein